MATNSAKKQSSTIRIKKILIILSVKTLQNIVSPFNFFIIQHSITSIYIIFNLKKLIKFICQLYNLCSVGQQTFHIFLSTVWKLLKIQKKTTCLKIYTDIVTLTWVLNLIAWQNQILKKCVWETTWPPGNVCAKGTDHLSQITTLYSFVFVA